MKTVQQSWNMFNVRIWAFYYYNRCGWFRLFGYGLLWKDINIHDLTFSQRNDYSKGIKLGKWYIGICKKY